MFWLKLPLVSYYTYFIFENYFINDYINRNRVWLCTLYADWLRLISIVLVMSRISLVLLFCKSQSLELKII